MEIKVDAEAVNKVVADAIIKSVLGERIAAAIQKALDACLDGYNSPVKQLVETELREQIRSQLQTVHRPKIVEAIAAKIQGENLDRIVSTAVDHAMKYLKDY